METSRKKEIVECNVQFYQTLNCDKRIVIHQGSSRSGKTYALCQYIIVAKHTHCVNTLFIY
jgi:hypothetical protein